MHERKGACMYYYRTNSSKQPNKDPGSSVMYFERSRSYLCHKGQRTDLALTLFKSTSAASKIALQFRSMYHSRDTCAFLELVKIIIHIDFTDGIYWLLWNIQNPVSSTDTLYGSYFVQKKHQLAPRWYCLRKGAAGWSWVGMCLWEKYSQKFLIKEICCSEICLFYCSENSSEFLLKKHTGHQTRHTYRQYLSWFQMGLIFFPYKTSKTDI